MIALRVTFFLAQAQLQPDVAAANHRLVAVESVGVKPGTRAGFCQRVGGFVDSISGGAANSYCNFVHVCRPPCQTRVLMLLKLRMYELRAEEHFRVLGISVCNQRRQASL